MMTAISLYTVVIAFMLVAVSSLLTGTEVPPPPALTIAPIFQEDMLVNQWTSEGLNISNVENVAQAPNELSKETLNFMITDDVGSHKVMVFLYNEIAGIVNDGKHLTALTTDGINKMEILQTAVIVYPAAMNEATVTLLMSAFNTAPTDSV
jgi:hypothetical protein